MEKNKGNKIFEKIYGVIECQVKVQDKEFFFKDRNFFFDFVLVFVDIYIFFFEYFSYNCRCIYYKKEVG